MVMHATDSGIVHNVVDIDKDHVKATAFNMLFMIWRRETAAGAYRRGTQIARELASSFREGIGILHVVEVDAIPPDSEARKAMTELLQLDGLMHFSVTHEGTGFKAAAVRAIVSGNHALIRPKCAHTVHSSLVAAAAWHAGYQKTLGRSEGAGQIQRIAQDLRDLHVQRYP